MSLTIPNRELVLSCYNIDVRVKLKYALPLAQMAVASALLWWSYEAERAIKAMRASPAFTLLVSINAPVAFVRVFWYQHLPDLLDSAVLVAAVGWFWYWIALNINSWREQRSVYTFTSAPLRVVSDLLLIAVGAGLALAPLRSQPPFASWPYWPWFIIINGLRLAWCVALVLLFSRDLMRSVVKTAR